MKKIITIFLLLSYILYSCKKDSAAPEVVNINTISAQISYQGGPLRIFQAANDSTVFSLGVNENAGDTLVSVYGFDAVGNLRLHLVNPAIGTFLFAGSDSLGRDFTTCQYFEGDSTAPSLLFISNTTDSTGAVLTSGSYTITHMSRVGIVGTMDVTLRHTDSSKVSIQNCSFKGTF